MHLIDSLEEVLNLKQNFQKSKVVTGKTSSFAIGPFCTTHSICLKLASGKAVLCGIIAVSILELRTKKLYSRVLKNVFVFRKIGFKDKVVKTFKISSGCHKNLPISQTEGVFENP